MAKELIGFLMLALILILESIPSKSLAKYETSFIESVLGLISTSKITESEKDEKADKFLKIKFNLLALKFVSLLIN